MKKDKLSSIITMIVILSFFVVPFSFALYKVNANATGELISANWNVSLNQDGVNNYLSVIPGSHNASYNLNVTSNSKVDVVYTVIISNLPAGVEVSFDGGSFVSQINNTVTFTDIGTILYSDSVKTKTHVLTFKALTGSVLTTDKEVDIDVTFRQIMPNE